MIEQILPVAVKAFDTFTDASDAALFPGEAALVRGTGAGRRAEFTTARDCARRAMRRAGVAPVPILSGSRGEPLWPPGVVGSITHCAGYRAAAVSVEPCAVGIDAEPDLPLPPGVLEAVSVPREREMLLALAARHPGTSWDRLLFSAKESVYKAWFPLAGRWLDFQDAVVGVDAERGTFRAELLVPGPRWMGRPLAGFSGRWRTGGGLIVTAVAAPASPCPDRPAHLPEGDRT